MRRASVLLAACWLAWAAAICSAARPKPQYFITVHAVAASYPEVPVSVTVAAPPGAGYAELREVGGRGLAGDAVVRGGQAEVTWILRDLPKGAWRRYVLRFRSIFDIARALAVDVREQLDPIEVSLGNQLFTRYVFHDVPKPFCWPVIGPTGKPVTRAYPMEEVEGESRDHRHHRSFWFAHGDVNGQDFWSEGEGSGKIVHRDFEALEGGPAVGRIRERNDWIAGDGKKVCEDVRELRVYALRTGRLMDFEVTVRATEGPVTMGDTKEGTMAFRVASSMEVTRGKGHILNSEGVTDKDTWGKRADWCDYSGPVDGKTVGIAILDNPDNLRHPTYWHVRDYGLFAANPFGLHNFLDKKEPIGEYTIPKGGSLTLRYRIYIHEGDAKQADVAGVYEQYAHPPVVRVY